MPPSSDIDLDLDTLRGIHCTVVATPGNAGSGRVGAAHARVAGARG